MGATGGETAAGRVPKVAYAHEVAARYVFNAPTKWTYEVSYMTYGTQFMLAAAYTLLKQGHMRTDVFYERWSARTRAGIDAISYLSFSSIGTWMIFLGVRLAIPRLHVVRPISPRA